MVKGRKSTHKHIFYICAFYKYLICAVLQNMYLTKKGNGKHMFLYAFGHYACLPIGALTEKKGEAENPSKSI